MSKRVKTKIKRIYSPLNERTVLRVEVIEPKERSTGHRKYIPSIIKKHFGL